MGVPVVLGKQGISRILELDLSQDEKKDQDRSTRSLETKARQVREFANDNQGHQDFNRQWQLMVSLACLPLFFRGPPH